MMNMPNHNYANGANYERKIANKLRQKGYYVMRSSGSKGLFDLIAIDFRLGQIKLIQLKNYKLSKGEFERIRQDIRKLAPQHSAEISFYALEHVSRGSDQMTLIR